MPRTGHFLFPNFNQQCYTFTQQPRVHIMNTELLTDEHMRKLFGTNYNGITYYNYDTNTWNRDSYLGDKILGRDSNIYHKLKELLESSPSFAPYELVAFATMPIVHTPDYKNYPILISNPTHKKPSSYVVGTIVRRDKTTGKIVPVPNTWLGLKQFPFYNSAICEGPFFFAFDCNKFPILTNALLKIHGNQK